MKVIVKKHMSGYLGILPNSSIYQDEWRYVDKIHCPAQNKTSRPITGDKIVFTTRDIELKSVPLINLELKKNTAFTEEDVMKAIDLARKTWYNSSEGLTSKYLANEIINTILAQNISSIEIEHNEYISLYNNKIIKSIFILPDESKVDIILRDELINIYLIILKKIYKYIYFCR